MNQKKFHPNSSLIRPVATGSYGCGSQLGDAQFKVIIQWLAASVANVPILIYYTCSNESLSKLDTVSRVLHGMYMSIHLQFPRRIDFFFQIILFYVFFAYKKIGNGLWVNFFGIPFFMQKILSTIQPLATTKRTFVSLTSSLDWKKKQLMRWVASDYLMKFKDTFLQVLLKGKVLKNLFFFLKKNLKYLYTLLSSDSMRNLNKIIFQKENIE